MGNECGEGTKRKRTGDDVKRVADIVMVLEAMGRMRGGRKPTVLENELAAEARGRLVEMCAALRPNDVFPSDAARLVARDLGFNKDPVGGSRAAVKSMSIAEKISITKKKMEDVKEITMQTPQNPFAVQSSGSTKKSENHPTVFHGSNRLFPDKPNQIPVSAGSVFVPVVPLGQASTPASSSTKQSQFSETPLRPSASAIERDSSLSAMARNQVGHFKMDGHPSGISYVPNVQEKTIASPVRPIAAAVSKPVHVTKLIDNVFPKSENARPSFPTSSQVKIEQGSKGTTTNILPGNTYIGQQPQLVNLVHAPSSNASHFDIARTIQKILQPSAANLPGWSPPSVDYMMHPLNCQICKISITDLESVLVCDACEKGVHLRCLKSFTQRAVSNAEWHCPKCLLSSNGKPLPPKYGKVTRNVGASKASSNTGGCRASSDRRSENLDAKVSNQQTMTNTNPSSSYPATDSYSQPELDKKTPLAGETQGNGGHTHVLEKVDDICDKVDPSHTEENGGFNFTNPGALSESSNQCKVSYGLVASNVQGKISELSSETKDKPTQQRVELPVADDKVSHLSQGIATSNNTTYMPFTEAISVDLPENINKNTMKEMKKTHVSKETTAAKVYETKDCKEPQSTNLVEVEWVGASIDTTEEKKYYQSCRIKGLVHSVQDDVLIVSDGPGLSPAKLQILWENSNDGSKWAIVNRYYSPKDLPDFIIRPSIPENDEVYKSNDSVSIEAGRICGPCLTLPLTKFEEESERRTRSGEGSVHPIFLCRWFYDKSKTLFQPINE